MVDRIGQGSGGLARNAILSAMKERAKAAEQIRAGAAELTGRDAASAQADKAGVDFSKVVAEGLQSVNNEIQAAERLPEDLVTGKIDDFSEVAAQIKKADLSFKFAMEIRNKLVDAYREVMRMHV